MTDASASMMTGALSATSQVAIGGAEIDSPRTTLGFLHLAYRLCTTVSAPFKGPLNPFPFKDKVFACRSRIRILLQQLTTIDETYGRNYV